MQFEAGAPHAKGILVCVNSGVMNSRWICLGLVPCKRASGTSEGLHPPINWVCVKIGGFHRWRCSSWCPALESSRPLQSPPPPRCVLPEMFFATEQKLCVSPGRARRLGAKFGLSLTCSPNQALLGNVGLYVFMSFIALRQGRLKKQVPHETSSMLLGDARITPNDDFAWKGSHSPGLPSSGTLRNT